ncbi:ArsR/SmtB family transcription factor [Lacisediminihabitans sp. FW035]
MTETSNPTPPASPPEKRTVDMRVVDLDSLKGLAHPLRVQILDVLSTYGDFTASGLADRLGESSGATSYHLRQLERHGFVREVEGKGTGRERWWERVPGGISLSDRNIADSPAARASSSLVLRQWERNRSQQLSEFVEHGWDELPDSWTDVSELTTINVRLTAEQLAEVGAAFARFAEEHIDKFRGQNVPGSRPVQIHFNAFPVIDGEVTSVDRNPSEQREETRES